MTTFGYIRLVLIPLLAVPPAAAFGQPAVAPSSSIRVIEIVDPWTGERVRQVAADLTPAEVSRIQRALAGAGFDPGRATGRMTSTTVLALGRFQASRGLWRCECVSYETILALRIRPIVVATIAAPVRQGYGSEVLVYVPDRRGIVIGHQPAVIVGHGPSVFVGHDPARGAGELGRRPPPKHHPRPPAHHPRPRRPRPGTSISGSGAPIRALTP